MTGTLSTEATLDSAMSDVRQETGGIEEITTVVDGRAWIWASVIETAGEVVNISINKEDTEANFPRR